MALVTHRTSKNSRYADVLEYYSFRHEESEQTGHYEPILDENGLMIERTNYAVAYITAQGAEAEPELWSAACMRTNLLFGKNQNTQDRKTHEYIISHPAEDREHMTMGDLMEEGKAFVLQNLPGYDALICVHRDTDNDHIHISISSVRAIARTEEAEWMMRDKIGEVLPCEMMAGGKHQDSPGLRMHMNDWLLEYTRQHGLIQKDNNAIAQVHRAQRHGSKNEQMRAALLEAASRSCSMKDLRRIMKEDYSMELKVSGSGNTISILYPGKQKYVRLRTLDLEPGELTRRFIGTKYVFTKEAARQQVQKEIDDREKKKYIQWLQEVRTTNNDRAESTVLRAEEILSQKLRSRGERYNKEEFQDLRYLIRQAAYVSANLQTELEKVDRLLARWDQYRDQSLSFKERKNHGGYVWWCGCSPDSNEEFEGLKAERDVILAQKEHTDAMHDALMFEAERWKGRNDLTHAENHLAWTKQREKQLKQQLKHIKASRKKLWEIAYHCEKAAMRYSPNHPKWNNVHKFRRKWIEAMSREQECMKKVKEIKQKKKAAKSHLQQVKRANSKLTADKL